MRRKILMQALLAAGILLGAPPVAAQVGLQAGGLVSWLYEYNGPRAGFYGGVHYDLHDRVRVGVLYVNKGREDFGIHSIEAPITYRQPVGEIGHVFVGVAPSYDDHGHRMSDPFEISALFGLAIDVLPSAARRIQLEAAFSQGLIGAQHDTTWVPRSYKTVRVGLNIR
ncbi:MAG: hypothetical protein OXH46_14180 [Gemmatimonadetes bacterium]|nr:hypothetical protein [Gemmatimonadota bacterium]